MHLMKVLELILLFAGAIGVIPIDVAAAKSARVVRPFGKSAKSEKSGKSISAIKGQKAGKEKRGPREPPFGKSDKGGKSHPATPQYKVFAKSNKSKKHTILGSRSPIPSLLVPTSTVTRQPTVGIAMATGEPIGEPTTAPPSSSKRCTGRPTSHPTHTIPPIQLVANEINPSSGTKLIPSDAIGRSSYKSIAIYRDTAVVGAPIKTRVQNGVPLNESTKGAAFVFVRDANGEWSQTSKLVAPDGAEGGYFGRSVAVSDDAILVGAYGTNDDFRGSVHVFRRSLSAWVHQAKLLAPDGASNHQFGNSVAIHRETIVIGAPNVYDYFRSGSAHVFILNGYDWIHQAKLVAPDTAPRDKFGYSVDIHENTVAVGAWGDGDRGGDDNFWRGSVNIFVRCGNTWTHQAKLLAPDGEAYDQFGRNIGIDADSIVVGAASNKDDLGRSGSAYVFDRNGDNWIYRAKLLPPDRAPGDRADSFGSSVSIHGNLITVGADGDNDNGIGSGSAYVFARNGRDWMHQAKLIAPDIAQGDSFGARVSVHNGTALVGSHVSDYAFSG